MPFYEEYHANVVDHPDYCYGQAVKPLNRPERKPKNPEPKLIDFSSTQYQRALGFFENCNGCTFQDIHIEPAFFDHKRWDYRLWADRKYDKEEVPIGEIRPVDGGFDHLQGNAIEVYFREQPIVSLVMTPDFYHRAADCNALSLLPGNQPHIGMYCPNNPLAPQDHWYEMFYLVTQADKDELNRLSAERFRSLLPKGSTLVLNRTNVPGSYYPMLKKHRKIVWATPADEVEPVEIVDAIRAFSDAMSSRASVAPIPPAVEPASGANPMLGGGS